MMSQDSGLPNETVSGGTPDDEPMGCYHCDSQQTVDACVQCNALLCAACMEEGCCGNVPAWSSAQEELDCARWYDPDEIQAERERMEKERERQDPTPPDSWDEIPF